MEISKEELKELIVEAFRECHPCQFNEEERVSIRDMVAGVKIFKRSILTIVIGILLGAIGFAIKGIHGVLK